MTIHIRSHLVAAAALAVAVSVAVAARPEAQRPAPHQGPDPGAGFDTLRALAGTWTFTGDADQGRVSYEVVSGGSAVLERVMNGEHGEAGMVSVIFLDDDRLVLQHYCSAGNQPRLVSPGLDGDEIRFTFDSATSRPPVSAGHIHGAVFRFPDGRPFESHWTWRQDGTETTAVRRHAR